MTRVGVCHYYLEDCDFTSKSKGPVFSKIIILCNHDDFM